MMVGLLGILQARGAYVPLDPDYPDERLAYMLQDSRARIILTQEKLRDKLKGLIPAETQVIALDRQWSEISDLVAELKAQKVEMHDGARPHHLAYVIYTSGSTGQPKGVLVEHHSLVNYAIAAAEAYTITSGDRMLQFFSLSFDAAAEEIFPTLARGATLVLRPNDLLETMESMLERLSTLGITVLSLPTAVWHSLVAALGEPQTRLPKNLRVMVIGGERALPQRLREWRKRVGDAVPLLNTYGPTEATIVTTASDLTVAKPDAELGREVSIGKPVANTKVYVLDRERRPVPLGVTGELYIGGEGVARGYLGRPELTAERFLHDPFGPAGGRMYRTGDLVRFRDDGELEFRGRVDDQVKIRGYRIELGEIEAQLNQHPRIKESVVIVRGEEANQQLIAFYRAGDTTADHVVQLPTEELREHSLRTLPEFMTPAAFVSLAAIPLDANGKVDRRALARMEVVIESGQEYLAPRTDTEMQLVDIWSRILDLAPEKIGVNDNFFELGGHSLLATQLIAKIRSELNVDLPLRVLFERASVAQLAESVVKAGKSAIVPIRPIDRAKLERLPLSFAQERLWFIHQLDPETAGYNLPAAVTIKGELDIEQLEEAFNVIIARHENLRTLFPSQDGQAQQLILDHLDFKLERKDLSHYRTREERDRQAKEICRTEAATPFDLSQGPLLRGRVIKLAEQEHILILNMHHIISDGWSTGVLVKELDLIREAFRQGRSPKLAPLPIQYVDYSVWQRQWLEEGETLKRQLGYWKEKLAGVAESLDLATDYPRPSVQSFAGATQEFALDGPLARQLKLLAEAQGCTLFMVLLAACKVLLYRYTGQNDICVGSPIANRQYGETEGLIGMFVNTLALRSHVGGEETFAGLLRQVKATCLEAYEHQDAPFEKVVDLLGPQRNLAMSPLFQVMVILQNADMGAPDLRIQPYSLESGISKFDLSFDFAETPEGLAGALEYSTALYKPKSIERMVKHFLALCQAITATPTAKIRDLEYVGEAEKQQLLVDFNDTRAEYPREKCLHEVFVDQVALYGGKAAVVCGEEQLTYQQLYERSRDLALYMQSLGVKPEDRVALCTERSLDMVVSLLGILQAGGAYVPLDPAYPEERLAYMLRDSGAMLMVTEERLEERLRRWVGPETPLLVLDRQRDEIGNAVAALKGRDVELQKEVKPRHLAYVIYTSGSTGEPKGVAIEHHSPVTLVQWASQVYSGAELAGVLASTSISFDLSVYELFVTLANGGTIVLVANALGLVDIAKKQTVTLVNTVPSVMEELVRLGAVPDTVQTINLAGEALSQKLVDAIYQSSAVKKVYDLYGPSEDTTYSTCILRVRQGVQSIGRPIANTQIYILDPHNHPQPIGVPGELHIAGDGLARGYLNRPELTREKFVANPFQPGTRMYKTGDLAQWLDDGNIQYLGRIDTQVKIRGFRIELGEIEARLNQHPEIEDSVVIAQGEETNKQIIAFYRAKDTQADQLVELPQEELSAHLRRTLPDYMVPAAFVSLAVIPLNANGKVDRRALAGMDVTIASGRQYVAPRNDTERQLVEIWAQVLKLAPEKIGVHDGFFELGGHSLLAVQLMAQISKGFKQLFPLAVVFTAPNIAALANLISSKEETSIDILVPIQSNGIAPPIFGVPGVGGNVLSLQPLSRTLGPKQPFYGLQAVGLDGRALPLTSVDETARANIAALKTVQPTGPYCLIGHSYGGVVAYEMARILLNQEDKISSLILLDSMPPSEGEAAMDEASEIFLLSTGLLYMYGATATIDLDRLRQSSTTENIQSIVNLLNGCGVAINGEQFVNFLRVFRANHFCYRTYKPVRLSRSIDVSLYRSTQGHRDEPSMPCDYGWNQLLQNPIRIYDVEADHLTILDKVLIHELDRAFTPAAESAASETLRGANREEIARFTA
jgi:amino acid adenylation domain-containing protein